MSQLCKQVERALVSQQALLDEEAVHLEECESCAELRRLGQSLGRGMARASAKAAPLGFATRLAAQGHARIMQRRRRRLGFATAGGLASVAVLLLLLGVPSSPEASRPDPLRVEIAVPSESVEESPAASAAPSKAKSAKTSKSKSKSKSPKSKSPKGKSPKPKSPKPPKSKTKTTEWEGSIHLVDPRLVHNGEFPASRCLDCHRSGRAKIQPRHLIGHPKIPAGKSCVDCHDSDAFGDTPRSTLLTPPVLVPKAKPIGVCDEVSCLVNPGQACCPREQALVLGKNEGSLAIAASKPSLIYLDGKKLGTTPLRKKVRAGKHKLRVVPIDGSRPSNRVIDLKSGDRLKLKL
jgi:hypothetical protein